jgi:hypothetical protein
MELDLRAIPGSRKFVATAAPHHGQAFGSLVLVDADVEDDDRMSPVRRITPEIAFPESQGGSQTYGTAWPLSEDYFLAVYDPLSGAPGQTRGASSAANPHDYKGFNYGIYLVDSFGNRELLYRDAEISCLSPIPLRPRPMPRVEPATSSPPVIVRESRSPGTGVPGTPSSIATVALMDVYDSLAEWPAGTRIAALRIVQVLPMTVPSGGPPHETGPREPTAGDSVVPARQVLGTVPVEPDGSAHFRVPAGKEVFFQALDANGLAVQSMRSVTYAQAGERLVCQGCHENRWRSPQPPKAAPLALRRDPSPITPDVEGSKPYSYPRLVQPVLDRNCVPCHTRNADKAPNLAGAPKPGDATPAGSLPASAARGKGGRASKYYPSYDSLVRKYGFWSYGNGLRTTPGKFGAKAAPLYQMLAKGHHDLKLSAEDMHRITLWLDCCSLFYGVYEKDGGEAQFRGEVAQPTLE